MTNYTIRVQAVGGKFLADDIGGARIVIRDANTGEMLASGVTSGDSGNLYGPAPSPKPATAADIKLASKSVIAAGDDVWWLVPDEGSSKFVADLKVSEPTLANVEVTGPLGGLQSAATLRFPLWLSPDKAPPALPGYVFELPGLLVYPIVPQIHFPVKPDDKVYLQAKVTMMCGCPVAASGYWPADDFVVEATVQQTGSEVLGPAKVELFLSKDEKLQSTFIANWQVNVPKTGSGILYWKVTFDAFQKSTGNAGSATTNFYCQY